MLPKDPVILLSYINTQLRDFYADYKSLCEDLEIDGDQVKEQLRSIGYEYQEESNQFR